MQFRDFPLTSRELLIPFSQLHVFLCDLDIFRFDLVTQQRDDLRDGLL